MTMSSSWEVLRVEELSAQPLEAIFANEIAGVRIPGFVGPEASGLSGSAAADASALGKVLKKNLRVSHSPLNGNGNGKVSSNGNGAVKANGQQQEVH